MEKRRPMFRGDFGLKASLKQINEEILSKYSLYLDIEGEISLDSQESLSKRNEESSEVYETLQMEHSQVDVLPKEHTMNTRSFERALRSYNLPQFVTPNTTPTDIDLQDKKNRRQMLSYGFQEDEVRKNMHRKIPDSNFSEVEKRLCERDNEKVKKSTIKKKDENIEISKSKQKISDNKIKKKNHQTRYPKSLTSRNKLSLPVRKSKSYTSFKDKMVVKIPFNIRKKVFSNREVF